MGVINVLPLTVINKIAAGEVIERPASVVKELVENALDAEAALITVEIEDGGKKMIRVTDDGVGMEPDDLALAFSSHATSKLQTGDDLFFITTMGFRGEALSSIGAVSHARIVSRRRGSVEGGEVEVNGGAPEPVRAKGAPEGTTVEVADLFFNVPARRKFLKQAATESAHIVDAVSRVALAHPDVGFRLAHNGREVLNLRAAADRRRRVGDLYGRELAEALIEVDSGDGPVRVTGFVAPPVHSRANAKMQLTFVNGRYVRDRSITHAISAAYEGMLISRRYPMAFVFLQVDPREVDVNVHPTKIEVRFHRGPAVHQTVLNAAREALRRADLAPTVELPPGRAGGPAPRQPALPRIRPGVSQGTPFDRPISRPAPAPGAPDAAELGAPPAADEPPPHACFQVRNAYIIEERADGVAILDQHALHERILFSQIRERLDKARLESQRLLIPAVVELGKADTARLLAEKEGLAQLGIEVSEFGPDSVAVNAVPALLGTCSAESILHDVLAELGGDAADGAVETRKLAIARLIACKAAVKAGDRLTRSEMTSLLGKAATLDERDTCPHGRPTCIFFPFADLERQFKRQ